MLDFLSSKVKKKAFVKALKDVESSGAYINFEPEYDSEALKVDIAAQVADLAHNKKSANAEVEETLDISKLSAADVSQQTSEELRDDKMAVVQPYSQEVSQSTYQSMFGGGGFLHGDEQYDDIEFLNPKMVDSVDEQPEMQPEQTQDKPHRNKFSESVIQELIAKRKQQAKAQKTPPTEPVKPKPVKPAAKKTVSRRKRKRKFDADIIGGFDF